MTYTFARVSAAVNMRVEDYYPQKKRWWVKLREKNGKVNEMPCHHDLEAYLDEYIEAAGIAQDSSSALLAISFSFLLLCRAAPGPVPPTRPRRSSPANSANTWRKLTSLPGRSAHAGDRH
jgi:hypothetical protein